MSRVSCLSLQFTGLLETIALDPTEAVEEAFQGIVNEGFPFTEY